MLCFGSGNVAYRKDNILVPLWQHHQDSFPLQGKLVQNGQHIFGTRCFYGQIVEYDQLLVGNFIRKGRANCQTAHFARYVLVIWVRPGAKDDTTMTELWRTNTTLASAACSLLPIWFFISARYFCASFGRSIALATIHQLCSHNL